MLAKLGRYKEYFVRGGPFYHSLQSTSNCLDWCCQFALSDPNDDDFCTECDHEHTLRDETALECDAFFRKLIKDSEVTVHGLLFNVTIKGEDGIDTEGTASHLRDGVVRVSLGADSFKDVPWDKSGLSHSVLNMLSLTREFRFLLASHQRYRRHLYLDRNQSYGEIQLNRFSKFVVLLDYMMKLRAKAWKADTSVFHLMMNKGTSVHVFCFKGQWTTC